MTRLVGRKPVLPPETVQALRVWAALGRSVGQVARNLGVSPTTIRRYLDAGHKREVARHLSPLVALAPHTGTPRGRGCRLFAHLIGRTMHMDKQQLEAIRARDADDYAAADVLRNIRSAGNTDPELEATINMVADRRALLAAYDALAAERDALRKDAERYREWRRAFRDGECGLYNALCDAGSEAEHDAAIDALLTADSATVGQDCQTLAALDSEDAARFRWLCDDHADRAIRHLRNSLLERMSVMSLSAVRAAISIRLSNVSEQAKNSHHE